MSWKLIIAANIADSPYGKKSWILDRMTDAFNGRNPNVDNDGLINHDTGTIINKNIGRIVNLLPSDSETEQANSILASISLESISAIGQGLTVYSNWGDLAGFAKDFTGYSKIEDAKDYVKYINNAATNNPKLLADVIKHGKKYNNIKSQTIDPFLTLNSAKSTGGTISKLVSVGDLTNPSKSNSDSNFPYDPARKAWIDFGSYDSSNLSGISVTVPNEGSTFEKILSGAGPNYLRCDDLRSGGNIPLHASVGFSALTNHGKIKNLDKSVLFNMCYGLIFSDGTIENDGVLVNKRGEVILAKDSTFTNHGVVFNSYDGLDSKWLQMEQKGLTVEQYRYEPAENLLRSLHYFAKGHLWNFGTFDNHGFLKNDKGTEERSRATICDPNQKIVNHGISSKSYENHPDAKIMQFGQEEPTKCT